MITNNSVFVPIPKKRNAHCKVEIAGDDLTPRTLVSSFSKPVTSGIGTFSLKLSNPGGILSNLYSSGDIVKFYADNSTGATLQFWGRVDYPKDNISSEGQVLEIEGRHRSYLLTETGVCYNAEETSTSSILKAIIDQLPDAYGFTYDNIATTTDSMSVSWNYKPFWECVQELCSFAGNDCYVDDDLDFHYFTANSIANTSDAIVEGDTLLKTDGFGTNDYAEKTRVTVIGKDKDNLPIIYTAISDSEGTDKREVFIRDSTANTFEKVKNAAEAKLEEYTNNVPQAKTECFGLESVNPGENIWMIVPRQKIHGQYKIINITHRFGMKIGGWRTNCSIEKESGSISSFMQKVNQQTRKSVESDNLNKLNYSMNFDFETDVGSHSTTQIADGVLQTTGGASGTWTSSLNVLTEDATEFELRVAGESLPGTKYYASSDGGVNWQEITTSKVKYDFNIPGENLMLKIELNSADTQVYSVALLYS